MKDCSLFHSIATALLAVLLGLLAPCIGQCQLRIVTYNTATSGENFSPIEPRPGLSTVLQSIGTEAVNGIAGPIDVLLLQEQASVATSTQVIVELLNDQWGDGTYARGRLNGGTNGGGRAGIVYNTQTVDLLQERAFGRLSSTAQARQTLRYRLRPLGYDERSDFYAYVNHYKSGSQASDKRRRDAEATALRSNSDALGDGVQAIYAGDFNIQSCTESMFVTLSGPGAGQAIDPMLQFANGCQWKDNSNFRALHTQSPATDSSTGLIQGGVDDRFDFQLVTQNLFDGDGLSLIPESYHTFGNNGSHRINRPINDTRNTAQPRTVLNALAAASDHLPVVADYQLPAIMNVVADSVPKRVLLGAELTMEVAIANAAPVNIPLGADELNYSLEFGSTASGQLKRSATAFAAEPADIHSFVLPTQFATTVSYGLNVRNESQNAMERTFSTAGSYEVISPSVGSLRRDEFRSNDAVALVLSKSDTPFEFPLSIFNNAVPGSAGLDLDAISWNGREELPSTLEVFQNLGAGENRDFVISIPSSVLGNVDGELTLNISDEDGILGQQTSELSVEFAIRVALAGDANLDDTVGFDDFLSLSANFGAQAVSWMDGDFNRDSAVNFADFLSLSANFGQTRQPVSVPESSSGLMAIVLCGLSLRQWNYRQLAVNVSYRSQ